MRARSIEPNLKDDSILEAIADDPEGGMREVLSVYGPHLRGRLRKYAQTKRYGDAEVDDVYSRALLLLLRPEVRAEIRARGGDILAWLSRWGYWRLTDAARRNAVGSQKASAPVEPWIPASPSAAAQAVQAVLDQLSPRDRLVLGWKYRESLSNADVARNLHITEGAAKKAAHDARARLARLLERSGVQYK